MNRLKTLDVVQATELKYSLGRNGWTNENIKQSCHGDYFAKVLPVLLGRAEVVPFECVIDCDADPFVPEGWKVKNHIKGGQLNWNAIEPGLYLTRCQNLRPYSYFANAARIRRQLSGRPAFNANVLDFLLANQDKIPGCWEVTGTIWFWGTEYLRPNTEDTGPVMISAVRGMSYTGKRWIAEFDYLGYCFSDRSPAAMPKPKKKSLFDLGCWLDLSMFTCWKDAQF